MGKLTEFKVLFGLGLNFVAIGATTILGALVYTI